MTSTVLVMVVGDVQAAELDADVDVPLSELMAPWAQHCSHRPPEDLVLMSADNVTVLDPAGTLTELGLGHGSLIRLVAREDPAPAATPFLPPTSAPTAPPSPATSPSPATPDPPGSSALAVLPSGNPAPGPRTNSLPSPASVLSVAPTSPDAAGDRAALADDAQLPPKISALRRLVTALRAGVLIGSAAAPTTTATFAKPRRTTVGQRYRTARQATDRLRNLDTMIRTAPLSRCVVIAVVSPKGGPGKTTVTALLGTLLAEIRRDPVVALDANPDLGDLKDKLSDRPGAALVDDLSSWFQGHPNATPAQLWGRLGVGPHGLRYVATPRPPECSKERMLQAADFDLYRALIARLRDYAGIIVVDCGTGLLDPPVRAALRSADQIVLVTDSSATTARQVVAASSLLPAATPTWLVANKMPRRGSMVDLEQVVAAIPRIRGLTVFPIPAGSRLAENIVTPDFTWAEAPAEWQGPTRELAARLAAGWTLPSADPAGRTAVGGGSPT